MKHAKKRPPSSARLWLSCPAQVTIAPLYPNEETTHNKRGERAHALVETAAWLGTVPDDDDQDIVEAAMLAFEYIQKRREELSKRPGFEEHFEVTLEIPETGEFGTADILWVWDAGMEVVDFKNGYVPVGRKSPQLLCYLLGAIFKHGERKEYKLTIIQPNYEHVDGPIRSDDITDLDLDWIRSEIHYSMTHENVFAAGKHCRDGYCRHRGTCATFAAWAPTNLPLAYYPSDVNGLTDGELAQSLEQADVLTGYRDALRGEAMRRMLQQDKEIPGHKLVRGKRDREWASPTAREKVFDKARELGADDAKLYRKEPVTVKGVEDFFKAVFKKFGRGKWKQPFEDVISGALMPQNSTLSVVKDIDGRPTHRRGGEFGAIVDPAIERSSTLPDVL